MEKQKTNEVEWEHYWSMREISRSISSDQHNVEDYSRAIMEAYETVYQEIVAAHQSGDREVSYELTGRRKLTLEEDLEGLEKAFQWSLTNMEEFLKSLEKPDYTKGMAKEIISYIMNSNEDCVLKTKLLFHQK